jgi:hypothetical protein
MKDIPGFNNYIINENGVILNKKTNKIVKGWKHQSSHNQYLRVGLYKNGNRYKKFIHELVLLTYVGDKPIKKQVNHKDKNTFNNSLSNLEYVTASYNIKHAKGKI